MWNPIRMAVFGSISEIKSIVVQKSSTAYDKAKTYINKKRTGNADGQQADEPKYANNPEANIIDR